MDMRKGIPAEYHSYLSTRHSTTVRPEQRQGLSLRGLWTGLYLSLFLAIGAPYADTAMHASFMAWDFNTPGAIFLFLLLIQRQGNLICKIPFSFNPDAGG